MRYRAAGHASSPGQRLLVAIRECKADAVIVLELDRGFRNATDCSTTVERWGRKRIAL